MRRWRHWRVVVRVIRLSSCTGLVLGGTGLIRPVLTLLLIALGPLCGLLHAVHAILSSGGSCVAWRHRRRCRTVEAGLIRRPRLKSLRSGGRLRLWGRHGRPRRIHRHPLHQLLQPLALAISLRTTRTGFGAFDLTQQLSAFRPPVVDERFHVLAQALDSIFHFGIEALRLHKASLEVVESLKYFPILGHD